MDSNNTQQQKLLFCANGQQQHTTTKTPILRNWTATTNPFLTSFSFKQSSKFIKNIITISSISQQHPKTLKTLSHVFNYVKPKRSPLPRICAFRSNEERVTYKTQQHNERSFSFSLGTVASPTSLFKETSTKLNHGLKATTLGKEENGIKGLRTLTFVHAKPSSSFSLLFAPPPSFFSLFSLLRRLLLSFLSSLFFSFFLLKMNSYSRP